MKKLKPRLPIQAAMMLRQKSIVPNKKQQANKIACRKSKGGSK